MKRILLGIVATLLLQTGSLWARSANPFAAGVCPADQEAVIDSEAHCFNGGGVSVNAEGADSAKVACLEDKKVQQLCGQDGHVTRQQAFTQWYRKLQQFQARCAADGGTFAFTDTAFKEPQNESFCLQAQPEVGTNMFEESLCNLRSICPAVTVVCSYGCGGSSVSDLPTDHSDRLTN